MAVQGQSIFAPRGPPQPNGPIRASGSDPLSVRTVHRRPHFPHVALIGRLDGRSRPGVPLTHRTIARGGHDAGPIPAERRAEDLAVARMAQRATHRPPCRRIPQPGGTVVRGRSQSRAIGAEHQRPDLGAMGFGHPGLFPPREVVYPHGEIARTAPDNRQSFPVGTELDNVDRAVGRHLHVEPHGSRRISQSPDRAAHPVHGEQSVRRLGGDPDLSLLVRETPPLVRHGPARPEGARSVGR